MRQERLKTETQSGFNLSWQVAWTQFQVTYGTVGFMTMFNLTLVTTRSQSENSDANKEIELGQFGNKLYNVCGLQQKTIQTSKHEILVTNISRLLATFTNFYVLCRVITIRIQLIQKSRFYAKY